MGSQICGLKAIWEEKFMVHKSAEEAMRDATADYPIPNGRGASFICANCGAFAQHAWGYLDTVKVMVGANNFSSRTTTHNPRVCLALCTACQRETIFVEKMVVYPEASEAPPPAPDMPEGIVEDYLEASSIYSRSPRGAAALLRLAIQKLCPVLGSSGSDINRAIGELVAAGIIPPAVQQALDTVRVIGNEAVHPGTMDLQDDRATAKALFGLVNFIVEKAITDPKLIGEIYGSLPPAKLAGIAARDGVTAAGTDAPEA